MRSLVRRVKDDPSNIAPLCLLSTFLYHLRRFEFWRGFSFWIFLLGKTIYILMQNLLKLLNLSELLILLTYLRVEIIL